jgi:hypothetical protein
MAPKVDHVGVYRGLENIGLMRTGVHGGAGSRRAVAGKRRFSVADAEFGRGG